MSPKSQKDLREISNKYMVNLQKKNLRQIASISRVNILPISGIHGKSKADLNQISGIQYQGNLKLRSGKNG